MNSIEQERIVTASLKAAAEACQVTCGNWFTKSRGGPNDKPSCPCAEAIKRIDPKDVILGLNTIVHQIKG